MSYKNEDILRPLPVDVDSIENFDKTEKTELTTWLDEHLLSPIDAAGSAITQEEYEKAYDDVFEALDALDDALGKDRYLAGSRLTKADITLYSILVRFDSIFYFAYRLNRNKIKDFRNLSRYVRELYHLDAFHEVTDFEKIKNDYYEAQTDTQNPYHIVMLGPDMSYMEE